jgi:hypothetical protein
MSATRIPVTVGEYARRWAEMGPPPADHGNASRFPISKHIDGTKIGSMRLAARDPPRCRPWIPSSAPGTLRLLVALLRSIFAAAVQDRLSSRPARHAA